MKKSSKIVAVILAVLFVVGCFAACSSEKKPSGNDTDSAKVKVGFIYLHDENSTYDKNFIDAAKEACAKKGVEMVEKKNIGEDDSCREAALDLVDQGCNIIFADSFGHEDFMIEAAKAKKDKIDAVTNAKRSCKG